MKQKNINQQIAVLKRKLSLSMEKEIFLDYIKQIINEEERVPENRIWIEQCLVRKGESFDEWYNRFFIRTKGHKTGNWTDQYAREIYNMGGIQVVWRHLEKLLELRDERLEGTTIYEKYKKDNNFKKSRINLAKYKKEDIMNDIQEQRNLRKNIRNDIRLLKESQEIKV